MINQPKFDHAYLTYLIAKKIFNIFIQDSLIRIFSDVDNISFNNWKNTLAFSSLSQCYMYMYYHWLFVCDEALLVWVQTHQLVKGLGTVTLVHQFQRNAD